MKGYKERGIIMKNAVKYLVLSISCVICFVVLVLMVALLCDIGNLSYPATLILPMISYALFIGGFVILTIWAFKFSSNKEHKTFLIISLSVFLASAVVFLSAKIVNPIISQQSKTECFDFTNTEFITLLNEKYDIGLNSVTVIDSKEKGSKIATYTCDAGNDIDEMVHYSVQYDEITDNVSYISFFFDKNIDDVEEALTLYYTHIGAIAKTIEPTVDIGAIYDEIINGFKGDNFAIYEGVNFGLNAMCDDEYYHASFAPLENVKG